ncbi:hypothetical protein C4565_00735 [Candidatus Parcubacteria bacterium]|nr:MAG: hypothetical protein C4565_00735 [Candidatus Parcubacteria bacterium]
MDIHWAINQLVSGQKVRRKDWVPSAYIQFEASCLNWYNHKSYNEYPKLSECDGGIQGSDVLANDWELFERKANEPQPK